jgi:hypothetical protein
LTGRLFGYTVERRSRREGGAEGRGGRAGGRERGRAVVEKERLEGPTISG